MAEAQTSNVRKNEKVGQVVSTKMQKTIVVEVIRRVPHPIYKRIVTKKKKYYAHDGQETAKDGDVVRIIEHRPMSKLKRWILGDIVRRAVQVGVDPSQLDVQVGSKRSGQPNADPQNQPPAGPARAATKKKK